MTEATSLQPNPTPSPAAANAAITPPVVTPPAVTPPIVTAPEVTAPVIPEKYEFVAPQGLELDTALVDGLTPLLKEMKVDQPTATKLFNAYTETQVKQEAALDAAFKKGQAEKARANLEAIGKEWGALTQANQAIARKGIVAYLSAEEVADLDASGFGSRPGMLKLALAAGRLVKEDAGVPPNGPAHTPKSTAAKLFPSMVQQ